MRKLFVHPALLAFLLSSCRAPESDRKGCLAMAGTFDKVAAVAMGDDEIAFDFYDGAGRRLQHRYAAAWRYRDVGDLPPGAPMRMELMTEWRDGRCEGTAVIHGQPRLRNE